MSNLHNNFDEICTLFNLGTPIKLPERVYGGLLHIMWCVETGGGSYAIKQLSADIKLTEDVMINYELTECIAASFIKLGIPAVSAIEQNGKHLIIIDGHGFLVYPWVHAKALDKDTIAEKHAIHISTILAKMHLMDIDVPEITEPEFAVHGNDKILKLIDKAESSNRDFAKELRKYKDTILAVNDDYQNAILILRMHVVVSHGDLDQKNVLWDEMGNPILIDWESAHKLNPTYEIVNASLDWSGITTDFDSKLFIKMIEAYQDAGGIIDKRSFEASFYGVLGNWINWMVYNIERACTANTQEQKDLGVEQVNQTIATIIRLQNIVPELISNIEGVL